MYFWEHQCNRMFLSFLENSILLDYKRLILRSFKKAMGNPSFGLVYDYGDREVVLELVNSCPRGQVRRETIIAVSQTPQSFSPFPQPQFLPQNLPDTKPLKSPDPLNT